MSTKVVLFSCRDYDSLSFRDALAK
jgi:hypothetical protein